MESDRVTFQHLAVEIERSKRDAKSKNSTASSFNDGLDRAIEILRIKYIGE